MISYKLRIGQIKAVEKSDRGHRVTHAMQGKGKSGEMLQFLGHQKGKNDTMKTFWPTFIHAFEHEKIYL